MLRTSLSFLHLEVWIRSVAVRYVSALVIAMVMFAGVTAWRFAEPNAAVGVTFLYTAPIALLAVTFGLRGGTTGAGIGVAFTTAWAQMEGAAIGDTGYLVRAGGFLAVGLVVGWQADRRHTVEREADQWFSMSGELACVATLDGRLTRVNPAWTKLLGWSEKELLETPFIDFVHPDDVERTLARRKTAAADQPYAGDFENRYRAKDGAWHWLQWNTRTDGRRIYAAARDITEQKQLERQLRAHATEDPLTGVANRRGWDTRIAVELQRSRRSHEPLSVVLIDFDNLKQINDTRGHAAGDEVLTSSALAWIKAVRAGDILARLGGDEFALLLPDCGRAHAEDIVARMRAATPDGHSFSAGIAEWDGTETATALVRRADQALYAGKTAGRGCTVVGDGPAVAA
jgi:diguanylate cyclase (GGDEF)-like protein/PAS domain S-box-containing protein